MKMKKYEEIYQTIKEKILTQDYKAKQQLPFEKDLCETFNTSKMTVKRALDMLVEDGLIIKRRGSGTFVKDLSKSEIQRIAQTSPTPGFTSLYQSWGDNVSTELLNFSVVQADVNVAEKLNINVGSFVYDIQRLRSTDNEPIVIEKTYYPIDIVPGLEENHVKGSIYDYITNELSLNLQSAHRYFSVKTAEEEEADKLNISVGAPVAVSEQIVFLDDGEAMEYSLSLFRHDKFRAEMIVTR